MALSEHKQGTGRRRCKFGLNTVVSWHLGHCATNPSRWSQGATGLGRNAEEPCSAHVAKATCAAGMGRKHERWQESARALATLLPKFCQSFANLFLRVFGFKGAQARTRWKTVQVWPQRPRGIRLNDCTALRDGYEISRKLVQIVSGFQSHFTRSPDARG